MQTIKNAFGRGDSTKVAQEPLSGETGAGIATDPYDAGNAQDQPGSAADDALGGTTAGIAALTTEDSSPTKQDDITTSDIVHPTSAEPENPTANTESTEQPSAPSEPPSITNPPTNHTSDPPHPDREPSKTDLTDTNGDLSGTLPQPTSSIDAPPSDALPSSVNNADVVAPVSEESASDEKPLGEVHGTSLVEPSVTADHDSSGNPLGEEQGTSIVEPSVGGDPVSSEKPLEEQGTSVVEPSVSTDHVSSEKPLEAEQGTNSLVEPPVSTDPVSSGKPLEQQGTGVVEPPVYANPVPSEKPLEAEQGTGVVDPVPSEKALEEEKGASIVEPPASVDPVSSEKPVEAEQGTSVVEPPATMDRISDQKPLHDEQAADNSIEESVGKDVPTGTEDEPSTDITHASDKPPEAPSQSIPTADAPAIPETSTGLGEPAVHADPASGQEPFQKEQGADRPLEEPAGEQAAAITEETAKTEDAQAGGDVSGAPPTTELSDPADQSENPIETVSHVTEEKGIEGESKGSGTGEQYVQSTGVAADGGDFDAAKPGAGKEADRLLEEPGTTTNVTSSGPIASTEEIEDPDTGKKPSLGTKIKDKLHIGKH